MTATRLPDPSLPLPAPSIEAACRRDAPLRLALPKGRMQEGVLRLLADAGIEVTLPPRGYRPRVAGLDAVEAKLLKPQTIVEMLESGGRDCGFAGADWVGELGADLVEVLDTGLDPVRLVVAAPREVDLDDETAPIRLASEFTTIAEAWLRSRRRRGRVVRSFGATEVLPPEDADAILDVAQTGSTLEANGLAVRETVMESSTRLYASRSAWSDPSRRARIERLAMLLRGVLDARSRVMLELNVPAARLDDVLAVLPCMRRPTVAPLAAVAGDENARPSPGYAVKAAVPRAGLPELVARLKARGGTDLVISAPRQVIP